MHICCTDTPIFWLIDCVTPNSKLSCSLYAYISSLRYPPLNFRSIFEPVLQRYGRTYQKLLPPPLQYECRGACTGFYHWIVYTCASASDLVKLATVLNNCKSMLSVTYELYKGYQHQRNWYPRGPQPEELVYEIPNLYGFIQHSGIC